MVLCRASFAFAFAFAPIVVAACNFGSGHVCTEVALYAIKVKVYDAATNAVLCGAIVVARDGAFSETLREDPALTTAGVRDGCVYSGATERAGTYDVDVQASGYLAQTVRGIVVAAGDCHVDSQSVYVSLTR